MDFFKSLREKKEWEEEYAEEWKDTTWDEPVFGNTVHSQIVPTETRSNN